jgi:hypothetical protein
MSLVYVLEIAMKTACLPCKHGAQTGYHPFRRIETKNSNSGMRFKTKLK